MDELLEYAVLTFMNIHNIKDKKRVKLVDYPALQPMTTFNDIKKILLNEYENDHKML